MDDLKWQAILHRDPAHTFFYGVHSTRIFCRPTCPSRRPKRENVTFFATTEQAEQAGYRACRRCHPTQASTQDEVVAQVQHLLSTVEPAPSLSQLGQAVGLSPYHLQRVFKAATGLSPKEFVQARRSERLKEQLRHGATVTDAMYEAGYGSTRALYTDPALGMTPGTYRKGGLGADIAYGCADSPLGPLLVAATAKGVCAIRFGSAADTYAELQAEFPRATLTADDAGVAPYLQAVSAHLAGQPKLDLPLDLQGTAFQRRVWAALQAIPYGQTQSYSQVADRIGQPQAVRAVARACATNPVAMAVPCHRVIRANGDLSGYRWGLDRKASLLSGERRATPATPS